MNHPTEAQMQAKIMWITLAVATGFPALAAVIHLISRL